MDAPATAADRIQAEIAALGTAERAEGEKRYLKSDLQFLGATVPAMRKVVTTFAREHPDLDHDEVMALVEALWSRPVHECRAAAIELLVLHLDLLNLSDLDLVERLARESRTWALIDRLAAYVVGHLDQAYADDLDAVLRRWAEDDDFWVRRTALLAHLGALRDGGGNFERFGEMADAMLEDREFFIRKAIGWVLRDAGRKRPNLVADWLEPRATRAAGLTVREAVRHLPEDLRQRVLAASGR